MMPYVIGVVLAVVIGVFARLVGYDRDRAFYPAVLTVVASYYGLFAIMGGSLRELAVESVVIVAFAALAVLGFKKNPWLIVAGLAAHGIFDFWHGDLIANAGVPVWWPAWCMSYDVAAAVFLAVLLRSRAGNKAT